MRIALNGHDHTQGELKIYMTLGELTHIQRGLNEAGRAAVDDPGAHGVALIIDFTKDTVNTATWGCGCGNCDAHPMRAGTPTGTATARERHESERQSP